jgi:NAD(P)-dependent dehydrogenase (short-subunit alcohol dehydrogenase family)
MTVSLVTGAGSGIGAATSRILADRGDQVVCADLDAGAATAIAAELPDAIAVDADVTIAEECDAMVAAAVERYGRIDALVTCAGIELGGDPLDFDVGSFRRVIDVNVTGSYLCAQRAARVMRDTGFGGRIVLIGSINSHIALPGAAAYCASKGAVLMLGRSLAVDLAEHGIRVNVIGPGVTDTPMSAVSLADPDRSEALMSRVPLRRPADPAEIARAAAWLTSDDSSYVTGAFIPVDGGWLAG